MIIESLVTTENSQKELNVAPMGVTIQEQPFSHFEIRPFKSSKTFANLAETGQGVMHFSDDANFIARAALELELPALSTTNAKTVSGQVLLNSCRAFEFEVVHQDLLDDRTTFACRVTYEHRFQEFEGFNRGRSALIEAAVLASRIDFIPLEEINQQLLLLKKVIERTGGANEQETYEAIRQFVLDHSSAQISSGHR